MQKEIKRIHVLQAGLFLGVFYAVLGLIFALIYGAFFLLVGAAGMASTSSSSATGGPGPGEILAVMGGMGIFMIILIPILYGAMGFIGGVIGAAVYNLIAKIVGGIKFDVVEIGPLPNQLETTAVTTQ